MHERERKKLIDAGQLDLGFGICGLALTTCAPRRASKGVIPSDDVTQLVLLLLSRECEACGIEKSLDSFVRNGRFYRRTCKACWAAQARAKELEKKNLDGLDYCKRINRLWPAVRTA